MWRHCVLIDVNGAPKSAKCSPNLNGIIKRFELSFDLPLVFNGFTLQVRLVIFLGVSKGLLSAIVFPEACECLCKS